MILAAHCAANLSVGCSFGGSVLSLVAFSFLHLMAQALLHSRPTALRQTRIKYVNALDLKTRERTYFWEGRH